MSNKVIFLQDFFIEHLLGGAELHDDVVVKHFEKIGILYEKRRSIDVTIQYLKQNKDKVWFISNFSQLSNIAKAYLAKECSYIIYEHDYKFVDSRNPVKFKDFVVPQENKVNINFYRNAHKIVCLSKFHREIFDKNLNFTNIVNINCSMWSDKDLDMFRRLASTDKNERYAVIRSPNPIKKTQEAVNFCEAKGLPYDLISSPNYSEFIKMLSKYKGLVFMTGHPEPTPRVAIEAKMLNCKFVSSKTLIGVAHEEYFSLTGEEMINCVAEMRDVALSKLVEWVNEV